MIRNIKDLYSEDELEDGIPDFICPVCKAMVDCTYIEDNCCLCCFCDKQKIKSYLQTERLSEKTSK